MPLRLRVPLLLLALLLAGCASPIEPKRTPVPEAFSDAACGFLLTVPSNWARAGSAASGAFLFESPPSSGYHDLLFVEAKARPLVEASRSAALSAAPGLLSSPTVLGTRNGTLGAAAAFVVEMRGTQGATTLLADVHIADFGPRSFVVTSAHEEGKEPSTALAAALASFNATTTPPRAECGGAGASPIGPTSDVGEYRNDARKWALVAPEGWTAQDLSGTGEAVLFTAPSASGAYPASLLVVAKPAPRGTTLDAFVDESVAYAKTHVTRFELVEIVRTTLSGEAARDVVSTEEHTGTATLAHRTIALRGGQVYWLESQEARGGADAQRTFGALMASFHFLE